MISHRKGCLQGGAKHCLPGCGSFNTWTQSQRKKHPSSPRLFILMNVAGRELRLPETSLRKRQYSPGMVVVEAGGLGGKKGLLRVLLCFGAANIPLLTNYFEVRHKEQQIKELNTWVDTQGRTTCATGNRVCTRMTIRYKWEYKWIIIDPWMMWGLEFQRHTELFHNIGACCNGNRKWLWNNYSNSSALVNFKQLWFNIASLHFFWLLPCIYLYI